MTNYIMPTLGFTACLLTIIATRFTPALVAPNAATDVSSSISTQRSDSAPSISLVGAAYDERRGKLVIVGYNGAGDHVETWERTNTKWARVSVTGPSPRDEPLVAFDRARNTVVLYGGSRREPGPFLTDTWEWNGTAWSQRATVGPPLPLGGAMSFDAKRNRIVLFDGDRAGGNRANSGLWTWSGSDWTAIPAAGDQAPEVRGLFAFAYDETRSRFVLFGGFHMDKSGPRQLSDTWEWDGAWHEITSRGPSARDHAAMIYDPHRRAVVMHGGGTPAAGLGGETWQFDGTRWSRITSDGPVRGRHRMVFDAKRGMVELYGGWMSGNKQSSELWELQDTVWSLPPAAPLPPAAYSSAATYDIARQRVVVFGGYRSGQYVGDTWEWDGIEWTKSSGVAPPARNAPAAVYDEKRGRVLLFGGDARLTGDFNDTWERVGDHWRQLTVAGPPGRSTHAMAYDSRRDRVVLFGGFAHGDALGDTWEFDGVKWTQVASDGPPGRGIFAMTYDASRGRTVLFGGNHSPLPDSPPLGDTWEWDGADWRQINVTGPTARDHTQMVYDPVRRLTVLHGGGGDAESTETWNYDGHAWKREIFSGPLRRSAQMVFDTRGKTVLLYGGFAQQSSNELWRLEREGWRPISQ